MVKDGGLAAGARHGKARERVPLWRAIRVVWSLFEPEASPLQRFVATGVCVAFALLALLLRQAEPLAWVCVAASLLFGGLRTALGALRSLASGRPDIDVLMILAAVVSTALGHWDDGVILLVLFSLSDALERYAIVRTRRSIESLMDLRPATACVVRGGEEILVPVERVQVGEPVRVRPGERIPIDGEVVEGRGAVDESVVTGESLPVDKGPGAAIFAGTINLHGSLLVRATRPAADSTIARIVRLVEQAQERKPRTQRLIERWQTPYVLGVLGACGLTIAGGILVTGELAAAVYAGMVLLVAASPCAVVLASPVAILATVTRGARHGILFKGGAHIERLAQVRVAAFDKTGTVTLGRPVLAQIEPLDGTAAEVVLSRAASLERFSEHPLGLAVVKEARARGLPIREPAAFASLPGLGVAGVIDGVWVGVGRRELFEQQGRALPARLARWAEPDDGETHIFMWSEDGVGGVLTLRDQVRAEAAEAIALLRRLGLQRVVMLTGDRAGPAGRVAGQLGFCEYHANLRPKEKLHQIAKLAAAAGGVVMVGDGVNDAPALAAATVGVAMGAAGTDVALETADVVLLRDDLRGLAEAVHLARHCARVIRQSLGLAFGTIVLLVAGTLGGWLTLPVAVIGHEGSTVLVMLNGLRLLWQGSVRRHDPHRSGGRRDWGSHRGQASPAVVGESKPRSPTQGPGVSAPVNSGREAAVEVSEG
jgi:Cd2+/Zn2+-exporting ATPase